MNGRGILLCSKVTKLYNFVWIFCQPFARKDLKIPDSFLLKTPQTVSQANYNVIECLVHSFQLIKHIFKPLILYTCNEFLFLFVFIIYKLLQNGIAGIQINGATQLLWPVAKPWSVLIGNPRSFCNSFDSVWIQWLPRNKVAVLINSDISPWRKNHGALWCNSDSTLVSAAVIIGLLTLFMLLYVSFSHSDSLSAIPPNNLLSSKVNHSDIVFNFSPSTSFWKL